MLNSFMAIALGNAIVATIFALGILLLARWCHKPALLHGLWVVVLLKLVTPPMMTLPIPIATSEPSARTTRRVPPLEEAAPPGKKHPKLAEPPALQADATPETIRINVADAVSPPVPRSAKRTDAAKPVESRLQGNDSLPAAPSPNPAIRKIVDASPQNSVAANSIEPAIDISKRSDWEKSAKSDAPVSGHFLIAAAVWVWGAGAVFVFAFALRQIIRFESSLRHAQAADDSLIDKVRRLSLRLGLKNPPRVFLLDDAISPMLWGFGRHPRLLLPKELLPKLSPEAVESLILHELAHMRRGDHWVRVLELICQSLYWWHPVVWRAKKQLRIVEEECCDALVVEHCQGGVYAHALITTVDFLSHRNVDLPAAASGVGHLDFLKRRLTMIMQGGVSGRLAGLPKFLLLTLAVAGLSVIPRFVATAADVAEAEKSSASAAKPESTQAKPKMAPPQPTYQIGQEPIEFEKAPRGYPTAQLEVRDLAFSPDGKWLAAGYGRWDTEGRIVIYDFAKRAVLKSFSTPKGVAAVEFSPDGKIFAASYWNNRVEIRETDGWNVVADKSAGSRISRICFSPDGKYLAAASEAGVLTMWTVGDWDQERPVPGELFRFQKVAFSPDSKRLVAVGGSFENPRFGRGLIFDVETLKQVAKFETERTVFGGLAFSPDGKEIATGEFSPAVSFWNAEDGKLISTLNLGGTVRELCYRKDGQLAAASGDRTVYLIQNHGIQRRLVGHEDEALSVDYHPENEIVVTGSEDGTIRVWNANTGVPDDILRPSDALEDTPEAVLALAHSPDGRYLVTSHEDGTVRLREAATGTFIKSLEGHEDVVASVAFSPDSKLLATSSYDHGVKIWDVDTGKPVYDLEGHTNWVFAVAFSPDGKTLASGGYDKSVRLWSVETGKSVGVLEGHTAAVRTLAFSPDGKQLATGSSDRTVRLWDLEKKSVQHEMKGHTAAVRAVAFAPNGTRLASGSEDKTIRFWNPSTGESVQELKGHTGMVWTLAFSPRGRTLASAGFDNSLRLWNASSGAALQTLTGHQDVVTSLSYSQDSRALITGSYDKTLKLWTAVEPPVPALADLNLSDATNDPNVRFVVFTPDGKRMITGNQNHRIRLWDLATGKVIKSVMQPRGIRGGRLSPDAKWLATVGYGEACYLFDAKTLELLATLPHPGKEPTSICVSPDGKVIASGAWNGSIVLWDSETKEKIRELPKQALPVEGILFSPDGKLLATATGNYKEHEKAGTVKLWDVETWKELANLRGPTQKMRSLCFSADGKTLLAGGSQSELLVYDVPSKKLARQLQFNTEASAIDILADSRTAVLGGWDGRVELWDIQAGRRLVRYAGHQPANQNYRYIFDVAAAPDGSVVASAGGDGHVMLWPTSSAPPSKPLFVAGNEETAEAFHVALTPDGSHFAVARSDKTLRIYATKTGEVVTEIDKLNTPCSGIRFSADGKRLAGAMIGGKVFVWNRDTGEEVLALDGHEGGARRVAFSLDGKMLASCGWDETAAVWNLSDGDLLYRIPKQNLSCSDVEFSPDGKLLITSTGSWREHTKPGIVSVWNADDGSFFRKIENHGGEIKGVCLNPGGRYLASFGGNGAKVWLRINSKLVKAVGAGTTITAAEFSPDGQTLFAGHADGSVLAYDLKTGRIQTRFEGHQALIHAMDLSQDGTLLVTSSKDGTVKFWPASRVPAIPLVEQIHDDERESFGLAYSPNGRYVAVGGKDTTISLYDTQTRKLVRELKGHNGLVFRLAFAPDSNTLISGSSDGTARLWDVESGKQLMSWTAHGEMLSAVRSVAVSPDGKFYAGGNWDGETFLWNPKEKDPVLKLSKQSLPVTGIAFSPDGKLLATSTGSWKTTKTPGELTLWNAESGEKIAKLEGHTAEIKGILFHPKGDWLLSHSTDNTVRIWDVVTKQQLRQIDHDRNVNALDLRGDLLAIGDFQGGVTLLDFETGAEKMRTGGHYVQVAVAAFAPDTKEFCTVALDGFLKFWSIESPNLAVNHRKEKPEFAEERLSEKIRSWRSATYAAQPLRQFKRAKVLSPHGEKVWFAVYSPDGKMLATGGSDKTVKLWNAESMELLQTLTGHGSFTTHAAFSPDGTRLATVSWNSERNLKLWDVKTGKPLATSDVHKDSCRKVAFSPDGKFIATACEDHFVRVFTPDLALTLSLDAGLNAYSVAFSPDSELMAVGTGDLGAKKQGRILLYDVLTGKKVKEFEKSEGYVFHLQFLKDGKRLLAANGGAGCVIWNIDTGEMEEVYRDVEDTRWVEIDREEKRVIATARVGEVFLYERFVSTPIASMKASEKFIHCATFAPDGRHILVADEAANLTLWEIIRPQQSQVAEAKNPGEE